MRVDGKCQKSELLSRRRNPKTTRYRLLHLRNRGSSPICQTHNCKYQAFRYLAATVMQGWEGVFCSHVNSPVSECNTFDDGTCEGLFCSFSTMKTCVAVAYRPPNASLSSFKALLSFFSICISSINDDSYDIMMTGGYNTLN